MATLDLTNKYWVNIDNTIAYSDTWSGLKTGRYYTIDVKMNQIENENITYSSLDKNNLFTFLI